MLTKRFVVFVTDLTNNWTNQFILCYGIMCMYFNAWRIEFFGTSELILSNPTDLDIDKLDKLLKFIKTSEILEVLRTKITTHTESLQEKNQMILTIEQKLEKRKIELKYITHQ